MFEGFRPETIDFLWGIQFNNNKAWFEAHKQEYLEVLYNPMKALAEAAYAPLAKIPGMHLHVSRIYRDARYAHGLPYKNSLWFSIRHDEAYWVECPCLYFDLHPDYYGYGFAIVHPRPETTERFRTMITGRPDEFLDLVEQMRVETGFLLTGDPYHRKKPCPDERLEPYYNLKDFMCLTQRPIGPELFRPALADTVAETLKKLMPLYQYCQKFSS